MKKMTIIATFLLSTSAFANYPISQHKTLSNCVENAEKAALEAHMAINKSLAADELSVQIRPYATVTDSGRTATYSVDIYKANPTSFKDKNQSSTEIRMGLRDCSIKLLGVEDTRFVEFEDRYK